MTAADMTDSRPKLLVVELKRPIGDRPPGARLPLPREQAIALASARAARVVGDSADAYRLLKAGPRHWSQRMQRRDPSSNNSRKRRENAARWRAMQAAIARGESVRFATFRWPPEPEDGAGGAP